MKMKKIALLLFALLLCSVALSNAGMFDSLFKGVGSSRSQGPDDNTVASGLKEALSVGTENAVKKCLPCGRLFWQPGH